MRKSIFCLISLLNFFTPTFSQEEKHSTNSTPEFLEALFGSNKTFDQITKEADLHFQLKHPDLKISDLSQGFHKDGDYVKYQRWRSFWRYQLNESGHLADFTGTSASNRGLEETNLCNGDEYIVNWTNLNYPSNMGYQIDQGRTSCMAFHPTDSDIFYVGASFGGLWKTTDGGNSYTIVNDDLPLAAISGIVIDPANPDNIAIALSDIVWYGPASIGVYVSNDGGLTFNPTALNWEISQNNKIYYMDQDPNNGSNILVATSIGLFKTTDFFATNALTLSANMRHVTYSQTVPDLVFAGGSIGQFFRSTDGGDSFSLVTDFGNGHVRIAVPLLPGSTNVVATNGTNLQKSTDNGLTFTTETLPESNMVIEFAPQSDNVLNVGNFEVYRSDDFGVSFYPVSQWLGNNGLPFIHVDQRNVFVNPLASDYVYFCNDGGIFRYDNALDQFANLSTGLIITQYYDIAVSQSDAFVLGAGSQDNGNIFRASDASWNSYAQTGDGMGQDIDPTDATTRYWSYQNGALRRWQNSGNTGIAPPGKDGDGAWETPFKLDPSNSDRIVVAYDSVFSSIDQGDTWTSVGGLVTGGNLHQLAIAPNNTNKIYVSRGDDVYSNDGTSISWSSFVTPVSHDISDLEVDHLDENIVYISFGGYTDGKKIYKSIDGGANWINISYNLPNLPFLSLELYEDTDGGIFVGTYGAVYYMDNSSNEWRQFGCIPNTAVNDIEIQYLTNKIYLGTHGRGIFEGDIDFDVVSLDEEIETSNFSNLTAYPNPATDVLFLKAALGSFENAFVQAFDVLGRPANISYERTSSGELRIDVSALSDGNYMLEIVSELGQIETLMFNKTR